MRIKKGKMCEKTTYILFLQSFTTFEKIWKKRSKKKLIRLFFE